MYTYAQSETILARLHGSEQYQTTSFRGRLKHLQKLGVPFHMKPGKGKKVSYTFEHLCQWVFFLECSQFGFEPTWTVAWIGPYWGWLFERFEEADAAKEGREIYLVIQPAMMTGAWTDIAAGHTEARPPHMEAVEMSGLSNLGRAMWNQRNRCLCILDLSSTVRALRTIERETLT
jgi:hypothetical protein